MKTASVRPHRTAPVKCPVCERSVERRSRQQRYCSRRCMKAANYARKAGSGELLGHDTALGPNPHKSANKINELQRFMCANGLAEKFGWRRHRLANARNRLIKLRYIKPVRQAGYRSAALFRWINKGCTDSYTYTQRTVLSRLG